MSGRDKEVVFKKTIPLNLVNADERLQMRAEGTDPELVEEYSQTPEDLDAIEVWFDRPNNTYWVSDGHHTVAAYRKAGKTSIPAKVHTGTFEDAEDAAYTANNKHGKRRTRETVRRVILKALNNPRHKDKSHRALAELCGVVHQTITNVKVDLLKLAVAADDKAQKAAGGAGQVANLATPKPAGDSKTQVSAPAPAAAAPAPAACDPDAPAAPAPSLDQVGRALPADAQGVIDAFAELPKFASIKARIGALKSELDQLAEGPAGRWVGVNEKDWKAHVQSLHRVIRYCAPYAVCPTCGGRKCETCKHTGYLPEEVFNALAPEVRGTTRKGGKAA